MSPDVLNRLSLAQQAGPKLAKLKKSTDGMQAVFVKSLITEMRKSVEKSTADVPGNDIYQDMQNQVLAEKIGATAHLGISEQMFKPLANRALNEQAILNHSAASNQQVKILNTPEETK